MIKYEYSGLATLELAESSASCRGGLLPDVLRPIQLCLPLPAQGQCVPLRLRGRLPLKLVRVGGQ